MQLAVEAIVDAVDPRLRSVSRYQSKIAPGAERTIAHMRALARDLPEPIEFSRAAWSSDPLLNAFFATATEMPALLGRSEELRAFFAAPANAAAAEAHALLGMLKAERQVFAPAIVDGALRQDVAQTTVSFDKHRLLAPAAELLDCRRQVGLLILRRMAELALERITALGERATELEQRKAMLGSRLRMLNLRRNGIEEIAAGDASAEIAAIEKELKATVDDFHDAKASLATLDTRIEHIKAIFDAPAEHVSLARTELRVNRMGYKVAEEFGRGGGAAHPDRAVDRQRPDRRDRVRALPARRTAAQGRPDRARGEGTALGRGNILLKLRAFHHSAPDERTRLSRHPVRPLVRPVRLVALAKAPGGRPPPHRQGPLQRRPDAAAAGLARVRALAARAREDRRDRPCRRARRARRARAPGRSPTWRADGVGPIPFPPLFKRADGSPMAAPPRTPLAEGKVYYVGQPVAAVAAETREQAQDAAELGRAWSTKSCPA